MYTKGLGKNTVQLTLPITNQNMTGIKFQSIKDEICDNQDTGFCKIQDGVH